MVNCNQCQFSNEDDLCDKGHKERQPGKAGVAPNCSDFVDKEHCCMFCELFEYCPIIKAWVAVCGAPQEIFTFYCSEFKERGNNE
jgi:hypothetical protein